MKKIFSKILLVLVPFVVGFAITAGCSQSSDSDDVNTPPAPHAACYSDSDCPDGKICSNGTCIDTIGCPVGQHLVNGMCVDD